MSAGHTSCQWNTLSHTLSLHSRSHEHPASHTVTSRLSAGHSSSQRNTLSVSHTVTTQPDTRLLKGTPCLSHTPSQHSQTQVFSMEHPVCLTHRHNTARHRSSQWNTLSVSHTITPQSDTRLLKGTPCLSYTPSHHSRTLVFSMEHPVLHTITPQPDTRLLNGTPCLSHTPSHHSQTQVFSMEHPVCLTHHHTTAGHKSSQWNTLSDTPSHHSQTQVFSMEHPVCLTHRHTTARHRSSQWNTLSVSHTITPQPDTRLLNGTPCLSHTLSQHSQTQVFSIEHPVSQLSHHSRTQVFLNEHPVCLTHCHTTARHRSSQWNTLSHNYHTTAGHSSSQMNTLSVSHTVTTQPDTGLLNGTPCLSHTPSHHSRTHVSSKEHPVCLTHHHTTAGHRSSQWNTLSISPTVTTQPDTGLLNGTPCLSHQPSQHSQTQVFSMEHPVCLTHRHTTARHRSSQWNTLSVLHTITPQPDTRLLNGTPCLSYTPPHHSQTQVFSKEHSVCLTHHHTTARHRSSQRNTLSVSHTVTPQPDTGLLNGTPCLSHTPSHHSQTLVFSMEHPVCLTHRHTTARHRSSQWNTLSVLHTVTTQPDTGLLNGTPCLSHTPSHHSQTQVFSMEHPVCLTHRHNTARHRSSQWNTLSYTLSQHSQTLVFSMEHPVCLTHHHNTARHRSSQWNTLSVSHTVTPQPDTRLLNGTLCLSYTPSHHSQTQVFSMEHPVCLTHRHTTARYRSSQWNTLSVSHTVTPQPDTGLLNGTPCLSYTPSHHSQTQVFSMEHPVCLTHRHTTARYRSSQWNTLSVSHTVTPQPDTGLLNGTPCLSHTPSHHSRTHVFSMEHSVCLTHHHTTARHRSSQWNTLSVLHTVTTQPDTGLLNGTPCLSYTPSQHSQTQVFSMEHPVCLTHRHNTARHRSSQWNTLSVLHTVTTQPDTGLLNGTPCLSYTPSQHSQTQVFSMEHPVCLTHRHNTARHRSSQWNTLSVLHTITPQPDTGLLNGTPCLTNHHTSTVSCSRLPCCILSQTGSYFRH